MKNKKIIGVAMSCILACQLFLPVSAAGVKNKAEVESKKEAVQDNLDAVNGKIGNLKEAKESLQSSVVELDGQLNEISEQLTSLENDLETTEKKIKKTKKKLKQAKEIEETQYDAMKKRIRYMYENGDYAYMDMLLASQSIADLLNNAEYISKITEYDRNMLDKYRKTKSTIAKKEKRLKKEYEESKGLQAEVERQQTQVQGVMEQKHTEIEKYTAEISSNEALALEYANEVEAQNSVLAEIQAQEAAIAAAEEQARQAASAEQEAAEAAMAEAQRKAAEAEAAAQKAEAEQDAQAKAEADRQKQEAEAAKEQAQQQQNQADSSAASNNTNTGGGGFVWPCPSSYQITSDFGGRESPTAGASSNHMGIDIGAPTGTPIVAAASGTVVIAQYSPSAGNYVSISHGNGVTTVYMHASALYVSPGQRVSAGETIAAVGSTGYSTGPHLHFGVTANGSYVNPHNYVG